MRYATDSSWRRVGTTLFAGSPLRAFRLTPRGIEVADDIARGAEVAPSRLTERLVERGAAHPLPAGSRLTPADVTLVTPVFGDPIPAGRLLVDDGSTPPVADAAVRLELNRGPAAARNAARPLVTTELIAFVDSDVDLLSGPDATWLDPLIGHFDDPRVGLVAPRVIGETHSPLDLGDEPARVRAQTRVSYVPAAAVVVRLTAFDAVGGFDETLRIGEDVDFVWRLDQAGWTCRYEPRAVVWHAPRTTLLARVRQHRSYGTSAPALALRHPDLLAPWQADPATAGWWGAALVGWPAVAATIAAGNLLRLRRLLPEIPAREVARLHLDGQLRIAQQLAAALRREWWPIAAIGALFSRRVRRAMAVALAVAPRRALGDAAYGLGVWEGMYRHRTLRPLIPRIAGWHLTRTPRH